MLFAMDEQFVVRHSQRLLGGILVLIALIIWTTQGISLARSFLTTGSRSLEFGAWIFVGALILSLFLWVVFGSRRVQVRNGELSVEAKVLGLTFYRAEAVMISAARNLHIEKYRLAYKGKQAARYRLTAEFDGRARSLLSDLSETQANALMHWRRLAKVLHQPGGSAEGED